jgi:hypothetical protein
MSQVCYFCNGGGQQIKVITTMPYSPHEQAQRFEQRVTCEPCEGTGVLKEKERKAKVMSDFTEERRLYHAERQRVADMEAALAPFAEAAECIDNPERDEVEIWEHPAAMCITIGDLRRARKLLRQDK